MNKNIEDLINSLNENKVIQAKEYAEKLKEQKIMLAREDVSNHNIYAIISGIVPLLI